MCSEEGRKGPLSPLVCICTEWHRLCTAPSVVWSGGILIHQRHPVDGEAESLSLSVSEVSSLLRPEGTQLLFKSQPSVTLTCFTSLCVPSPFLSTPSHDCKLLVCVQICGGTGLNLDVIILEQFFQNSKQWEV